MFVVCPSCRNVFRVRGAHLSVAQGHVRCGGCQTLFDATVSLFESSEEAAEAVRRFEAAGRDIGGLVESALARIDGGEPGEATEHEPAPDDGQDPDSEPAANGASTASAAAGGGCVDMDLHANPVIGEVADGESVTLQTADRPAPVVHHTFDEDESLVSAVRLRTWLGLAACLALVLLLAGQYFWKARQELAARDAWRPWMERYCDLLGCDLPLRHDLARLEILEREVRNHPRVKDALLISATFVNEADFAQSWPVFEVTFSDVSGTAIAVRRFTPEEYLAEPVDPAQGMAPGARTRLVLEVVDPGKNAVSYQFNFL